MIKRYILPYLGLVLIHVVLGLQIRQPSIFADELCYLGHARYLSGVGHIPNLQETAFCHFGYSLFLLPAFWLFSDPLSVYRAVLLTNAFLLSSLYLVLYYLLHGLMHVPKKRSGIVAFTVCLYPAFLLQSNIAWAENAFIPMYALVVASFGFLLHHPSPLTAAFFGVITGFLGTLHPRGYAVIAVESLYLCVLAWKKVLPRRQIVLSLGCTGIMVLLTGMVNEHLQIIGWAGHPKASIAAVLSRVFVLDNLKDILVAAGQLLYLSQATYGLFLVGAIFLWAQIKKNHSLFSWQIVLDKTTNIHLFCMLTSLAIFMASCIATLHGKRADQIIYGRYNEGFLALYLAFALIGLYTRQVASCSDRKNFTAVIVSVIAVLTLVIQVKYSHEILSHPLAGINILGIHPLTHILGEPNLSTISLLAIVSFVIFEQLFLRDFVRSLFLLMALFFSTALYEDSSYFLPIQSGLSHSITLTSHLRALDDISTISYDTKFLNNNAFFSYQYLLPDLVFQRFASDRNEAPESSVVISGKEWPDAEKLHAWFLASEEGIDNALWILPGKLQSRLLQERSYIGVNLIAFPIWGIWERGFYGQGGTHKKPARWTNGAAKIVVPLNGHDLPTALNIDLSYANPQGTTLDVLVNGYPLAHERLSAQAWAKTFSLVNVPLDKRLTLELRSDTFVPREVIAGSTDPRTLGVLVHEITLSR